MKAAVHNERRILEEVIGRPLLVDRALRQRFAFDQRIHAVQHDKARRARADFLAGRHPSGAVVALLSRSGESGESTDAMLQKARAEASLPRVLQPPENVESSAPRPLEPEAAAILEKELRNPGDVSTILEHRDRFEVYRLIEITPAAWRVEAVRLAKEDFDGWYERARRKGR